MRPTLRYAALRAGHACPCGRSKYSQPENTCTFNSQFISADTPTIIILLPVDHLVACLPRKPVKRVAMTEATRMTATNADKNTESGARARSATLALGIFTLIGLVLASPPSAFAQKFTTLYNFCSQGGSDCTDGAGPVAGLVQGSDGNLYGTTLSGGAKRAYGTVFKITPGDTLTTLYSFCSLSSCTDGSAPEGALVQGSDGNFYGTTSGGGQGNEGNGGGTIFKITPSGTLTTLYSFCSQGGSVCTDGYQPSARLVQGSDGNFYGTTPYGGANLGSSGLHAGIVFKITPSGDFTKLWDFCSQSNCADGDMPIAGLAQGSDGSFYGTTDSGGANNNGTIFKITPTGILTTIYSFDCPETNCADGAVPDGGLVRGSDGNFYGPTVIGGTDASGTIFKTTPDGTLTTLYSLCSTEQTPSCFDGYYPDAALVQGTDGSFYGTTTGGGTSTGDIGETIFQVTPSGTFTTLYHFCSQSNCTDGEGVQYAALVQGSQGSFYGTTWAGGVNTFGTIFRLDVVPISGLLPSLLTFGPQVVGTTSSPQYITLDNAGAWPLSISDVSSTGDFAATDNCMESVAAGKLCAINVTFTPTGAGTRSGTLTITDNSEAVQGTTQTVALTGAGMDFSLSASATSATVAPGQSASYALSLTPAGGFDQAVSLTCTGAPPLSTCSISPNSVTFNGSTALTATVNITTTAGSFVPGRRHVWPPFPVERTPCRFWVLLVLALLLMVWRRSAGSKRPTHFASRRTRLALGLALVLTSLLVGCGGGGEGGGGGGNPGTPGGTYSLSITGTTTSGNMSVTRTTTLTLTVS